MKHLPNSGGAQRALLCSTPCPFSLLTSAKDARCSSSAVHGRAHTAFASAAPPSAAGTGEPQSWSKSYFFLSFFSFLRLAYPATRVNSAVLPVSPSLRSCRGRRHSDVVELADFHLPVG